MGRCIRPLIGEVPSEILKKYGDKIAKRMTEYANNSSKVGILIGLFWGLLIGFLVWKFF